MASGTGFKSALATEHGWVFATEVGPERKARLAFVTATPFWGVRRGEDGAAEVDESPLTCLTYADPGDRSTYAELSDPAYSRVFDAWPDPRISRNGSRRAFRSAVSTLPSRTIAAAAHLVKCSHDWIR